MEDENVFIGVGNSSTNIEVFEKIVYLINDFLNSKNMYNIADLLSNSLATLDIPNPTDSFVDSPKSILEQLLFEKLINGSVLDEPIEVKKANKNEKVYNNNEYSTEEIFPNIYIRDVENTWYDIHEDMGYEVSLITDDELIEKIPNSEFDFESFGENEEIVKREKALKLYPNLSKEEKKKKEQRKEKELQLSKSKIKDELEDVILEKIRILKNEFPGDMSQLLDVLGVEYRQHIYEDDDQETIEEKMQYLLVQHFKAEHDESDETENESYRTLNLKVIQHSNKTGFEETKDYPIILGEYIGGRYEIQDYLGSAAFSRAVQCYDHVNNSLVCVKIITNNKDFFDQSLDEIKLLKLVQNTGVDLDEKNLLQIIDYFYHKEHLFIVTELLRDNLYEFYKYNIEYGDGDYFSLPNIKSIAKQILVALEFLHNLNIIHCDLKPENILIKSYSRCLVKVIDLGSSCFTSDHLSSYVQSRSYRAPEVILGLPYDCKIDIWSLGCVLAELFTGQVLFLNDSLATLLARVNSIIGPFPHDYLKKAAYSKRYFTCEENVLYEKREDGSNILIYPKPSSLKYVLDCDDDLFIDFLGRLLSVDPKYRPTASEALKHPFIVQ